jgi:hypothetical protein
MSAAMQRIHDKLGRAEAHFVHLKAAIGHGVSAIHTSASTSVQNEPNRQGVSIKTDVPKPSSQWGIILGDVVHQLRSGLDHLVYALATRTHPISEQQAKKLSFPVFKKSADFDAHWTISKGLLESWIGVDEFAEVKLAQPYKRTPDNPSTDPLWVLAELDNIDKHRTILVLDNRVFISGSAVSDEGHRRDFWLSKKPVEAETQVFDFRWPHPVPPTTVNVDDVSRLVVFAETRVCDHIGVVPMVVAMSKAVESTIGKFDRFF